MTVQSDILPADISQLSNAELRRLENKIARKHSGMAAAQDGDKAAANVLLSEVGVWLERYFRRRVPPHQLDDLVQDVLLAFYTKRSTYDPSRPFLPWLAAIARYRWVDHLRKVYKHAVRPPDRKTLDRVS